MKNSYLLSRRTMVAGMISALATLAGCGGGAASNTPSIGGDTGTPSPTLTLNTDPALTLVSGTTSSFKGVAASYPNDISSMSWTISLASSTTNAKSVTLTNDTCSAIEKSSEKTPNGHLKVVGTCVVTLSPAAGVTTPTAYRLTLTTADTVGNKSTSSTLVTVNPVDAQVSANPVATINAPASVASGATATVTCAANGGYVPANGSYNYLFTSTPDVVGTTTGATFRFVAPTTTVATNYTVQCRATDANNVTGSSTAVVAVMPPPVGTSYAQAALTSSVPLGSLLIPGQTTTLDASTSFYFDGTTNAKSTAPLFYHLTQLSGTVAAISKSDTSTPTITAPQAISARSQMVFALTVSTAPFDSSGKTTGTTSTTNFSYFVDPQPVISMAANWSGPFADNTYQQFTIHTDLIPDPTSRPKIYYKWTQVSGTPVAFGGGDTQTIDFVTPKNLSQNQQTLQFKVVAGYQPITAANPGTASYDALISILPASTPSLLTLRDASVTNAFKSADFVTANVQASGTTSGSQIYYDWKQISGPNVTLGGANTSTLKFIAPTNLGTTPIQLVFTAYASLSPITASNPATASVDVVISITPP